MVGETISHYKVLGKLGQGGMGVCDGGMGSWRRMPSKIRAEGVAAKGERPSVRMDFNQ